MFPKHTVVITVILYILLFAFNDKSIQAEEHVQYAPTKNSKKVGGGARRKTENMDVDPDIHTRKEHIGATESGER